MLYDFIDEQFLGSKYLVAPTIDAVNLTGRIVVVTGSNIGLGYEAAVHLAKLNPAKLIIAVRSLSKGEAAKESLLLRLGGDFKAEVEVWELDLASFKSTIDFAERLNSLDRLDILLLNAAIATNEWTTTLDGYETTLQVNGLSTGLLAVLALPILARTAELPAIATSPKFRPHLTIVSSELHKIAGFAQKTIAGSTLAALNNVAHRGPPRDRYSVSKLINQFIAAEVSQLALAKDVIVSTVNPGLCVSSLRREVVTGFMTSVIDMLSRTTEKGATNLAYAATADTSATRAAYISVCQMKPPSEYLFSAEGLAMQKKLFTEMSEVWMLQSEKVGSILAV